jgi:hypothetical protein
MNLITMTACNRPEYTRRVLAALASCQGIERYTLLAHIEPGCKEVEELFHQWRHPWRVTVNGSKLGVNRNTCGVMDAATDMIDFWIHLEDDTVPSPDFLAYMEWARNRYADEMGAKPRILTKPTPFGSGKVSPAGRLESGGIHGCG